MTTVKSLIEQLQKYHNPEDAIVFQYMVSEHTSYSEKQFAPIAEYLMNNDSFGEESSEFFNAWLTEANDVLLEEQECKCSGCCEVDDILDNGYCEECFDQACDQEDSNNH